MQVALGCGAMAFIYSPAPFLLLFPSAGNKMPRNKNQSQQTIACQKKSIMDASRRSKDLNRRGGGGAESRPLRSSKPRFRFCHRHAPPDATVLLMPLPLPLPLKLPLYLRLPLLPAPALDFATPPLESHIDGIANAAVLQPKAEVIFQRLCECLSRAASVRECVWLIVCVLTCQSVCVCVCVGDFMTLDSGKRFVALHFQFRSVHFGNFE